LPRSVEERVEIGEVADSVGAEQMREHCGGGQGIGTRLVRSRERDAVAIAHVGETMRPGAFGVEPA
jgi:hypothetical protein